jgi:hypothetical protein
LSPCRPPFALCALFIGPGGRYLVPLSSPFRILCPLSAALPQPPPAPPRCLATSFLRPSCRHFVLLSSPFRTLRSVLRARWLLSCPSVVPLSNTAPPLSYLATARRWILGPGGRYLVPLSSPFRTLRPLPAAVHRPARVLRARWPLSCPPNVPLSHSAHPPSRLAPAS